MWLSCPSHVCLCCSVVLIIPYKYTQGLRDTNCSTLVRGLLQNFPQRSQDSEETYFAIRGADSYFLMSVGLSLFTSVKVKGIIIYRDSVHLNLMA